MSNKFILRPSQEGFDAVIVDTAGRLQIDNKLMGELAAAKKAIQPTDTLLVVDAMTGQEAATLVRAFNEAAPITGEMTEHCPRVEHKIHRQLQHVVRPRRLCAPSTRPRPFR